MDRAEFDQFADEYERQHRANIAITGESPDYFAAYKIEWLAQELSKRGKDAAEILDFGSGVGNSIPHFHRCFPNARLICADVSERSLELARARFGETFEAEQIRGARVFGGSDRVISVCFSACVFHHIAHEEHISWLSELKRVTHPGGTLCIFEHNPYNPLTLHAVNTCPFDVNAHLIHSRNLVKSVLAAGWIEPRVAYHVFFPRVLSRLRKLDTYLYRLPLGAQYSVTATAPR